MYGHAPRRTRRAHYRYGGGSICGARQPARYPRGLPSPLPAHRVPHRARGSPLVPIGERDTRMNWRSSRATLFVRLPAGLLGDGANHKGKLTTSRNRLTLSWVHRS